MRRVTASLLLLSATAWVGGCGEAERSAGPSASRVAAPAAETPGAEADDASTRPSPAEIVGRDLALWAAQPRVHLTLSVRHASYLGAMGGWVDVWRVRRRWNTDPRVTLPLTLEVLIDGPRRVALSTRQPGAMEFDAGPGPRHIQIGSSGAEPTVPARAGGQPEVVDPRGLRSREFTAPAYGWQRDLRPSEEMLANDLERLLDLAGLASWLQRFPAWSDWLDGRARKLKLMARASAPDAWGAVREIVVVAEIVGDARLERLRIEVMRTDSSTRPPVVVMGPAGPAAPQPARTPWEAAFPYADLQRPEDLAWPIVMEGAPHPRSDIATETVYELALDPSEPSPALLDFLKRRGAR